jgi:hypothetical protein
MRIKKLLAVFLTCVMVFGLMPSMQASAVTVGEVIQFGGYDWRVLEINGDRVLLLSDKILEQRRYHNTNTNITWATSDIRAYLNGEFFKSFNEEDKARIVQVTNTNPDNPWFGTPGGINTQDHIFLLSLDELVLYFGDADQLAKPESEREHTWGFYGAHADERIVKCINGSCWCHSETYGHWWWLRSPGGTSGGTAGVSSVGVVHVFGYGFIGSGGGVRPALWVYLDSIDPPELPPVSIPVDGNATATITPGLMISIGGGEPFKADTDKLSVKIEKKTPTSGEREKFFTALSKYLQ